MVEFIPAAHVRDLLQRVHQARQRAAEIVGPADQPDLDYWERLFESNAAEVIAAVDSVKLPEGFVVRYRCFGQRGADILVRPFVARASTDVNVIRRLIEWHSPPDSMDLQQRYSPTQDVELLYRHFHFADSATGYFDYWVVMQELWASARWTHSHLIASAEELSQLLARDGWQVLHPIEHYEVAAVRSPEGARLAVLMQCPLQRFEINLEQIEIDAAHVLQYGDRIAIAAGPRGYVG